MSKGEKLDKAKAAAALLAGRSNAAIATAAGSKARSRKTLREIGRRLAKMLRERGDIAEALQRRGYDVEGAVEHLVARLEAVKTEVRYDPKAQDWVYSKPLIDWDTRTRAFEQMMRATGILTVPLAEKPPEAAGVELSNAELATIADELARAAREEAERQRAGA